MQRLCNRYRYTMQRLYAKTLQQVQVHCAKILCKDSATGTGTLCKDSMQRLCNRYRYTIQRLCNRYRYTMQRLYAKTLQQVQVHYAKTLCKDSATGTGTLCKDSMQRLCNRYRYTMQRLCNRYRPTQNQGVLHYQFHGLLQEPKEKIDSFINKERQHADKCSFKCTNPYCTEKEKIHEILIRD